MYRRLFNKILKTVLLILLYVFCYFIISYLCTPKTIYNFVSDDLRVGDKYALIYLIGKMPVLSDAAGADVFRSRRCGGCFISNSRGFLPMGEYDAVAVLGDRRLLTESAAVMEPEKRYLLEAEDTCLRNRLTDCATEPKFTSIASRTTYTVCEFCEHLLEKRRHAWVAGS